MKKKLFRTCLQLGCLIMLTACVGDKDKVIEVINNQLAGTYTGTFTADIEDGGSITPMPVAKEITLTTVDAETVSLTLNDLVLNLGAGDIEMGDIVIEDCSVMRDEAYIITASTEITFRVVGECPVLLSGTVKDHAMELTLVVIVPMPGTNTQVNVNYTGKRR